MSAGLCPKSWAGSQEGKSPELTGTHRDPSCQPCAQPRAIPGTGDAAKPELSADPTGSPGGIPACSPAWHFSHFSLWWKGCLEHSLGLSLYSGTFCPKMTTSVFSFLLKNFWCPFSPSPPLIVPLLGLAAAVNPSLAPCWIKDAFSLPPRPWGRSYRPIAVASCHPAAGLSTAPLMEAGTQLASQLPVQIIAISVRCN